MNRLSFVLPAFGEAENLPLVLPRILAQAEHCDELEVIVVDDHSRDATFTVLQEWGARDPRIKALRLARNSGSHMAVLCGLTHCSGDVVVVLAPAVRQALHHQVPVEPVVRMHLPQ